jgi:hypothetical protein
MKEASILSLISSIFSRKDLHDKKIELDYLLEKAKLMSQKTNGIYALHDLQKLVMRPIQSIHMMDAYKKPFNSAIDSLDDCNNFGLNRIPSIENKGVIEYLWKDCRLPDDKIPLARLGSDIVLPTCWHSNSIIDLIGQFGEHRGQTVWKQDLNHKLIWWYPLNIFWVSGGNHSIAQGILNAEGCVKPKYGYDLSPVYEHVKFDGENWIDEKSGVKLGSPRYKEIGYVFEIGRLILKMKAKDE